MTTRKTSFFDGAAFTSNKDDALNMGLDTEVLDAAIKAGQEN